MRDQLNTILEARTRRPQAIAEAAARRRRRESLLGADNQIFLIAADHPARSGVISSAKGPAASSPRRR